MEINVHIELEKPLVLPINYNHIIQSIIYNALSVMPDYASFLHESGYVRGGRQYKMFSFSQLVGKYRINNKKIIFDSCVEFKVRSPEPLLINLLDVSFCNYGISFGNNHFENVETVLSDYTVENHNLVIKMLSPLTVYSTDNFTEETYYFSPFEAQFYEAVSQNFVRKYKTFFGIIPQEPIRMYSTEKNIRKFVTRYQGKYIIAWFGTFILTGERKYLDFLYQAGLGSRNSQGFGMFDIE